MKKFHYSDTFPISSESKRSKRKTVKNKADGEYRKKIQNRIRELNKLGFPQEEALIRINSEFSNSKYKEFFQGWVENAYIHIARKKRARENREKGNDERA